MIEQPNTLHHDVAGYVLGVLDPREAARFEDHLAECDVCAAELESLLPVAALMSQVDGASFVRMEESVRDGRMLQEMLNAVAYERSRVRVRRMLSLAAGVVAFVAVSAGSLAAGFAVSDQPSAPVAQPSASPSANPDGPGVGGFEQLPGDHFSATDEVSKVSLDVVLESHEWGTQVSIAVAQITGPLACQLVAVGEDSQGEVVYTWNVPPEGYGSKANPEVLFLQGVTALSRKSIKSIELQTVRPDGEQGGLLVAVDVDK